MSIGQSSVKTRDRDLYRDRREDGRLPSRLNGNGADESLADRRHRTLILVAKSLTRLLT
jgi:hypothetical protein